MLRNYYICSTHFNTEDFTNHLKDKLVRHRDVTPSQFPPSPEDDETNQNSHDPCSQSIYDIYESDFRQTPNSTKFLSLNFQQPQELCSTVDIHDQNATTEVHFSTSSSATPLRNKRQNSNTSNSTPLVLTKKEMMNSTRKLQMYKILKTKEKALKRLKRNTYKKRKQTLSVKEILLNLQRQFN